MGTCFYVCDLLGLNRKAKYITEGKNNRIAMNKYMKLSGDIAVGEEVVCRDGYGTLKAINNDRSIVITLKPWGSDETYKSYSGVY